MCNKSNNKMDTKLKKIKKSKKQKKAKNISILNAYKKNWLQYSVYVVAAAILSMENMLLGISIANFSFFWIYISHMFLHNKFCPFYYLHKYHHENNGLFSLVIEILLELFVFVILFFILPTNLYNEWVILFCGFIYTSVHNINYGLVHVNNVHALHHKNMDTNYGPDYYDVLFKTKHSLETEVENTSHYIPNIIVSFIIVYLFQQVSKYKPGFYENYRCVLSWTVKLLIVFFAVSTFYLLAT